VGELHRPAVGEGESAGHDASRNEGGRAAGRRRNCLHPSDRGRGGQPDRESPTGIHRTGARVRSAGEPFGRSRVSAVTPYGTAGPGSMIAGRRSAFIHSGEVMRTVLAVVGLGLALALTAQAQDGPVTIKLKKLGPGEKSRETKTETGSTK